MSLIQLLEFKEMETELYETSHFIMLHHQTHTVTMSLVSEKWDEFGWEGIRTHKFFAMQFRQKDPAKPGLEPGKIVNVCEAGTFFLF